MFQSKKNNRCKGKKAEQLALSYLVDKNHMYLAQNWFYGRFEVDIITEYQNFIVFTEVKSNNGKQTIELRKAVNIKKQKNLIAAANAWLQRHQNEKEARFDIIHVLYINDNQIIIEHIENAFYPLN